MSQQHLPPSDPPYSNYPSGQQQNGVVATGGPAGQIRGTGFAILMYIVTLGVYGWY